MSSEPQPGEAAHAVREARARILRGEKEFAQGERLQGPIQALTHSATRNTSADNTELSVIFGLFPSIYSLVSACSGSVRWMESNL